MIFSKIKGVVCLSIRPSSDRLNFYQCFHLFTYDVPSNIGYKKIAHMYAVTIQSLNTFN